MNVTSHGADFQPLHRRSILKGVLAAPAIAALGAAPALASSDTPVQILFREWAGYWAWVNTDEDNCPEEEFSRRCSVLRGIEDRIQDEPATSLHDLALKVAAISSFGAYELNLDLDREAMTLLNAGRTN